VLSGNEKVAIGNNLRLASSSRMTETMSSNGTFMFNLDSAISTERRDTVSAGRGGNMVVMSFYSRYE